MSTPPLLDTTRSCPFAPPETHVRLREQGPIHRVLLPNGTEGWVITRHHEAREILVDPRLSSDRRHPNYPFLTGEGEAEALRLKIPLAGTDGEEHRTVRRALNSEFTARRTIQLRPRIQEIVDEHIDALLAGPKPADLVKALSLPVPSLVICELLGVPYADHEYFQERGKWLVDAEADAETRVRGALELRAYLRELVDRKATEPGDDLLSAQLEVQEDRELLTDIACLLLVAGHETSANMISLGAVFLLDNPETAAAIREDPAKTSDAVEEMLRYFTIAEFVIARVASEDFEFAGAQIREGDPIVLAAQTVNHDPAAFGAGADEFDLTRGARHHLAFGYGPHHCIAQNLGRAELQIVFDTLLRRVPGLRLAKPSSELRYKLRSMAFGVHEVPVTW